MRGGGGYDRGPYYTVPEMNEQLFQLQSKPVAITLRCGAKFVGVLECVNETTLKLVETMISGQKKIGTRTSWIQIAEVAALTLNQLVEA